MESQFSQHCCKKPAACSLATGIRVFKELVKENGMIGEKGTSLLNILKVKVKRPLGPEDTTLLGKLLEQWTLKSHSILMDWYNIRALKQRLTKIAGNLSIIVHFFLSKKSLLKHFLHEYFITSNSEISSKNVYEILFFFFKQALCSSPVTFFFQIKTFFSQSNLRFTAN